jgi:hypothetical protein
MLTNLLSGSTLNSLIVEMCPESLFMFTMPNIATTVVTKIEITKTIYNLTRILMFLI